MVRNPTWNTSVEVEPGTAVTCRRDGSCLMAILNAGIPRFPLDRHLPHRSKPSCHFRSSARNLHIEPSTGHVVVDLDICRLNGATVDVVRIAKSGPPFGLKAPACSPVGGTLESFFDTVMEATVS